jgi:hypothetical protein
MNPDDFKELAAKIADGSASAQERLLFLKEMNTAMETIHEELSKSDSTA